MAGGDCYLDLFPLAMGKVSSLEEKIMSSSSIICIVVQICNNRASCPPNILFNSRFSWAVGSLYKDNFLSMCSYQINELQLPSLRRSVSILIESEQSKTALYRFAHLSHYTGNDKQHLAYEPAGGPEDDDPREQKAENSTQ